MFGDVGQARTNAAMFLMPIDTNSSHTCTKPHVGCSTNYSFWSSFLINKKRTNDKIKNGKEIIKLVKNESNKNVKLDLNEIWVSLFCLSDFTHLILFVVKSILERFISLLSSKCLSIKVP